MSNNDDIGSGKIRSKLIKSKEDWAKEGRLLTGAQAKRSDRLPPGQRLVKDWPVLDLGVQPHVRPADWALTIDGAVLSPLTWDWDTFMAAPQSESESDIHCVTSWSRYNNVWRGVSTKALCEMVEPLDSANHVILHSYDGYTTNVSLDVFQADDCLIAHSHDGALLTRQHGGPARLVIPQYYFWKSAKWIQRIHFSADDAPGFWERRGYHNVGDPWREERYAIAKPEEYSPD
ncbi:MAG: sulfite oxidase-like oxidoreductase [Pseudomonadota bacterium]